MTTFHLKPLGICKSKAIIRIEIEAKLHEPATSARLFYREHSHIPLVENAFLCSVATSHTMEWAILRTSEALQAMNTFVYHSRIFLTLIYVPKNIDIIGNFIPPAGIHNGPALAPPTVPSHAPVPPPAGNANATPGRGPGKGHPSAAHDRLDPANERMERSPHEEWIKEPCAWFKCALPCKYSPNPPQIQARSLNFGRRKAALQLTKEHYGF